jgi:DNA polymerase-4
VIRDSVPLFEKSSIDEFYIDLTGMDKYFGCYKFTNELRGKLISESGLPVSWGLASNKLVSKVATNEVKPNGQLEIPFGHEKNFLAPLSIMKIPGVGKETGYKLLKMGVETVKVLSSIPVTLLENLLGKNGTELWRRANGIDETPVLPYKEQRSISTEETFQQDSIDLVFLEAALTRMTEHISFQLRSQERLTGCVIVKLRYTDFETYTAQRTIPYCNTDDVLLKTAKELFHKLYERRQLVRMLGVRFSHLIPGVRQIDLFRDTQEDIQLHTAIDSIKRQFGEGKVIRAGGVV